MLLRIDRGFMHSVLVVLGIEKGPQQDMFSL